MMLRTTILICLFVVNSWYSARISSFSILLIGDSVDRFFTVEWCEFDHKGSETHILSERNSKHKNKSNMWAVNSAYVKPWINDYITTKDDPYFRCRSRDSLDSVSNVHMFGSSSVGMKVLAILLRYSHEIRSIFQRQRKHV